MLALLSITCYKVSWKKAQTSRQQVKYHGFVISKGHLALGHERRLAICATLWPNTKKRSKNFLGLQDLHNISRTTKLLYVATAEPAKAPPDWGPEQAKAFRE